MNGTGSYIVAIKNITKLVRSHC